MIEANYWKVEALRQVSRNGGCAKIKTISGNTYNMLDYLKHKETDDSIIITMKILGTEKELLHIDADQVESITTNK
ncbi:MAG: hypothetical protein ACD_8C00133G0023 [uncultured bacterium]|nr:MAG: hypothetical protein ACD_8C00133G0023 [uncultured bacterium]